MSALEPRLADLPDALPVFPLAEVLLLPRGHLPLNIFEPRYLAMVEDALATKRMIGMIQPADPASQESSPRLYGTGCAGRISRFEETGDGRYLIALKGVCRFDAAEELPMARGYRRIRPDWTRHAGDLVAESDAGLDRDRLLDVLRRYFDRHGLSADWDTLRQAPDERLVTCLSMICPFGASEKQALLEAPDLRARGAMLTTLVEMAVFGDTSPGPGGARQ